MIITDVIYSVVANKCPHCHKGKVFSINNPYNLRYAFTMNETCSECGLKYEREPGFFYGSMYANYALTSGLFIVLYLSDAFWFHLETWVLLTIIVVAILGLYPVTYRWGRLLWLNFFTRYDKSLNKK